MGQLRHVVQLIGGACALVLQLLEECASCVLIRQQSQSVLQELLLLLLCEAVVEQQLRSGRMLLSVFQQLQLLQRAAEHVLPLQLRVTHHLQRCAALLPASVAPPACC